MVPLPCNRVLDYSTTATACQHRMRNGRQASRQRWCPQGDLGDASTTWSTVLVNQVLAARAGSPFSPYQDGSDVGDSGFWPDYGSYSYA